MRDAFVRAITGLMQKDERVYLVTADMGYFIFDSLRRDFPGRFINLGIAEANMVGVASGLALSGKIPFIYDISSFVISRAFEQIKVDICYQNANVKIVGIGCGLTYGTSGPTHQAIADIALMRSLPNMIVESPADPLDAFQATEAAARLAGPMYIRLSKQGEPLLQKSTAGFRLGKAARLRPGNDAVIIATGSILKNALAASDELAKEGIKAAVVNMHTLKPVDTKAIIESAGKTRVIVTLEEHTIMGGLGSIVAEVLAELGGWGGSFKRLGMLDTFCLEYGRQDCLQKLYKLDSGTIKNTVKRLIREKNTGDNV